MGNDEAVTSSKSDKASSPVQDQPVVHPYPDWAAVQAYYGPGVPIPPPYFNSAVAPGHPPHPYLWGPQHLIPPFATPYPAIYPHGVYPHPPLASPSSVDLPAKSSSSKEGGLIKKLKGFNGLAVSIGDANTEITVGNGSEQSHSGESGPEGSSDGGGENNDSGGKQDRRKRSSEDGPTAGDKKAAALISGHGGERNVTPDYKIVNEIPSAVTCKPLVSMPASSRTPGMEITAMDQLKAGVLPEPLTQDERELKRERRKQSNRESARRSRLRKQAETEELAMKVESMGVENTSLRYEINRLKEECEKLKEENSSLLEGLKTAHNTSPEQAEEPEAPSVVVENFLSRIDELRQEENCENSNTGELLHQLMDPNPATDAVAAR